MEQPPQNAWPGSLRAPSPNPSSRCRQITIFGGGTGEISPLQVHSFQVKRLTIVAQATNILVDVFTNLAQANNSVLNYVIPISDNGGSSSELIRVFGGPGECVVAKSLSLVADMNGKKVSVIYAVSHPSSPPKHLPSSLPP
jgi:hypothetical protein